VASLRGKVIFYVPIGLTVPYFQVVLSGLKAAAAAAGLVVRPCDPAFSPSGVTQCLTQAANQKAAAVITDSIPNAFAQQAINRLRSKHIPLLVGDQGSHPGTDQLAYNSPPTELMTSLSADWIIADSKGTGDIILPEITDSAASIGYVENGAIKEIHAHTGERHLFRACGMPGLSCAYFIAQLLLRWRWVMSEVGDGALVRCTGQESDSFLWCPLASVEANRPDQQAVRAAFPGDEEFVVAVLLVGSSAGEGGSSGDPHRPRLGMPQ